MKNVLLAALILTAACSSPAEDNYVPSVVGGVKDPAKFEADLQSCTTMVQGKDLTKTALFGSYGETIHTTNRQGQRITLWKPEHQLINECMLQKGYQITQCSLN